MAPPIDSIDSTDNTERAQRGIQSVEVGGRVLRALADARRPMSLADLAAAAQLAPAQAHTYLVSLTRLGLIKRDHIDGYYEPGPLALRLGMLHLDHDPAYRAAVPRVQALAARIGFSVAISLPTPQGPTIVHYAHAGTPLHVNLHVGTVMALAATATGRTYCAFQPPAHWQAIWARQHPQGADLPAFPAQTRSNPRARHGAQHRLAQPRREQPRGAVAGDGDGALRLVLTVIGSTGGIDVDWTGPVATALRDAARDIVAIFDKAPA